MSDKEQNKAQKRCGIFSSQVTRYFQAAAERTQKTHLKGENKMKFLAKYIFTLLIAALIFSFITYLMPYLVTIIVGLGIMLEINHKTYKRLKKAAPLWWNLLSVAVITQAVVSTFEYRIYAVPLSYSFPIMVGAYILTSVYISLMTKWQKKKMAI